MTYATCILWTIAVGLWSAYDDAEQIALNERIHHVRQWFIRAALVGLLCLCAELPLLAIPMGALFSMVFRYTLNRLNDDWWWYLGPRLDARGSKDSRYDKAFHWAVWTFTGRRIDREGYYVYCDECPGKLAYIAEAVVLLIFAVFV